MDVSSAYLILLRPPSNIERLLAEVQTGLFRRLAVVSALALPPAIPLGCYTEPLPAPDFPRDSPLFTTGSWTVHEGALFLSVEPGHWLAGVAAQLRAAAKSAGAAPCGGVPPFCEGSALYLSSEAEEPLPAGLGEPPSLRWGVSLLTCMHVGSTAGARWWEEVRTEEIWKRRLGREQGS